MNKSKSKVQDIVTGEILGCRSEIYQQRVERAGSEEELERTYVGRNTKQLLREGKTVDEIRASLNLTDMEPVPQDVIDNILAKKAKPKSTGTGKPAKKKSKRNAVEEELQDSVPVDPDVLDFMNTGDSVDLGGGAQTQTA